jgi:ABC-type nitrate/sulfonate/bicarbonate transport system substrate-binding protein
MAPLEQSSVRIGIVRLTDCAAIAVAKERGEFAAEGLDVEIQRFESWAAIRDRLAYGEIEAAHMLSPMVVASAAGLGPFPGRFRTAFVLNLNGNAVTLSNGVHEAMREHRPDLPDGPVSAAPLAHVAAERAARGGPQLTFAVVYPFSMHNYELRLWLAAGGVHPDRNVRIIVAPPSRMVDLLTTGEVDGYCVGEPWNSEAARLGLGSTIVTSGEIFANRPEKVLGVRREWADTHPETHRAMLRALLRATQWLDQPANRESAADIIAAADYVDLPASQIASALTGRARQTAGGRIQEMPDFNVFHRYAANFPWRAHASWLAAQMIRWGQSPREIDVAGVAQSAFDPATYRKVAAECGVAAPTTDTRLIGGNTKPWVLNAATSPIQMGPDRSLDGRIFDPDAISDYLSSFDIQSMRAVRAQQDA